MLRSPFSSAGGSAAVAAVVVAAVAMAIAAWPTTTAGSSGSDSEPQLAILAAVGLGWIFVYYALARGAASPTTQLAWRAPADERPPLSLARRRWSHRRSAPPQLLLRLPPPLTRLVFEYSPVLSMGALAQTHRAMGYGVIPVFLLRNEGQAFSVEEAAECERLYQVRITTLKFSITYM